MVVADARRRRDLRHDLVALSGVLVLFLDDLEVLGRHDLDDEVARGQRELVAAAAVRAGRVRNAAVGDVAHRLDGIAAVEAPVLGLVGDHRDLDAVRADERRSGIQRAGRVAHVAVRGLQPVVGLHRVQQLAGCARGRSRVAVRIARGGIGDAVELDRHARDAGLVVLGGGQAGVELVARRREVDDARDAAVLVAHVGYPAEVQLGAVRLERALGEQQIAAKLAGEAGEDGLVLVAQGAAGPLAVPEADLGDLELAQLADLLGEHIVPVAVGERGLEDAAVAPADIEVDSGDADFAILADAVLGRAHGVAVGVEAVVGEDGAGEPAEPARDAEAALAVDVDGVQVDVLAGADGHQREADDPVEVEVPERQRVDAGWDALDHEVPLRADGSRVDLLLAGWGRVDRRAAVGQRHVALRGRGDRLAERQGVERRPAEPGARVAGDRARSGRLERHLLDEPEPERRARCLDQRLAAGTEAVVALHQPGVDDGLALERRGLDPAVAVGRDDLDLVLAGREVLDPDVAVGVGDALPAAERLVVDVDDDLPDGVLEDDVEAGQAGFERNVGRAVDRAVVLEGVDDEIRSRVRPGSARPRASGSSMAA